MKERNRKGQWCLTESAKYKMANHFRQFNKEAEEQFNELASEKYDFATCQRADGPYYGTGGTCRKGTPVKGPVPKKEKAVANMRAKDLKRRGADGEYITHNGQYIFSNEDIVLEKQRNHVFLEADAVSVAVKADPTTGEIFS